VRQSTVRCRIPWILVDRLLKIANRFVHGALGPLHPEIPSLEIELVSLRIDLAATGESRMLFRRKLYLDFLRDRASDFVLQDQHVAQVSLVCLGPEVPVATGMNQLSADPNLVTHPLH